MVAPHGRDRLGHGKRPLSGCPNPLESRFGQTQDFSPIQERQIVPAQLGVVLGQRQLLHPPASTAAPPVQQGFGVGLGIRQKALVFQKRGVDHATDDVLAPGHFADE